MARIFVARQLPGPALHRLREAHEVTVWHGRLPPSRQQLLEATVAADGLLALLTDRVDETLLAATPGLRAIANYAVGTDNIDLDATRRRGIAVGNTPDVLTEATADLAFTLLLAAARRLPEAMNAAVHGEWLTWEPGNWLGADVHGATLGIVGMGRIGQAVARRAAGFSMDVIYASRDEATGLADTVNLGASDSRHPQRVPLAQLLAHADFVSLHCPLTPDSSQLIDGAALALMKRSAILINTARGGLVDQAALADALRQEQLAGAALDVTDPEPPRLDDPLLDAPNLIVTPHIGSATRGAREQMAELAVDNLLAALAGRPMPYPVP